MNNRSFTKKVFEVLPKCSLKSKVRCLYYNYLKKNDFRIYYKKNKFLVFFKDLRLKFYDNPYGGISNTVKGYLRKYKVKKGDIVVDAGAYVGAFTLIASKMVGDKGKVIAFEPDKENYEKLLKNIELNDITNVIAINKGLWSRTTTFEFNDKHSGTSSFIFDKTKTNHAVSVPTVSLDDELEELRINKVDFIKMDIEGAEIEAIKGCNNILKNSDTKLTIASYHVVNGQKSCFELEKLLTKLGYNVETQFSEPLTTYANK